MCRVSSAFLWVEERERPDRSTSDSLWRRWEEEKQQLLLFEEVNFPAMTEVMRGWKRGGRVETWGEGGGVQERLGVSRLLSCVPCRMITA